MLRTHLSGHLVKKGCVAIFREVGVGGTLVDQHNILMGEPSHFEMLKHKYTHSHTNTSCLNAMVGKSQLTETHRSDLTLRDKDGKLELR